MKPPQTNRKFLPGLLVLGLFSFIAAAFLLRRFVDLVPAAMKLPDAAAAYRQAGFAWEASQLAPSPPVSEDDNAELLLREACQQIRGRDINWLGMATSTARGEVARAHEIIDPYNPAMAMAEEGSLKPHLDFHRDLDVAIDFHYSELGDVRNLVQLFDERAEIELAASKPSSALHDLATARRITNLLSEDHSMLSILTQIACSQASLRAVERCAASQKSQPAYLQKLEGLLADYPDRFDLQKALKTEAYLSLSTIRNLNPNDLDRLEIAFVPGTQPKIDRFHIVRSGYPGSVTGRAYLTRVLQTWTEIGAQFGKLENDPLALSKAFGRATSRAVAHREPSYFATKFLIPNYSQAGATILRDEAYFQCTKALVKAMEIKASTGAFPKTISQVPGKWIDPFGGKPLRLKLTSKGIKVYSIGPDQVDNGGIENRDMSANVSGGDLVAQFPPPISAEVGDARNNTRGGLRFRRRPMIGGPWLSNGGAPRFK